MAKTPKILACDDDMLNLAVVREILQKDYEIVLVKSGESCLAKLSEFQPDVLLLDIMMPGMDGYETCRRILATSNGNVPQIIFLSAKASTEERLMGYEAGADDYLIKPFDHEELRAKVRIHVRLRHALLGLTEAKAEIETHAEGLEKLVEARTAELQVAKKQFEVMAQKLADTNSKLAESNYELALQARHDSLTKLLTRAAWNEIAQREQDRSRKCKHPYSMVMIDIDYFKAYNDSQGHGGGDDCLRKVARSIANTCSDGEFAARYGGEEFTVLAPETNIDAVYALGNRIRNAVEQLNIPHPANPANDRVTVSVGVASGVGSSWEELLKEADVGLYVAKEKGRNQVCLPQTTVNVPL
ncbi:MAG: diguanylate cyclase [Phycisphaerales bacterium]|nr:diguanylate cyclase [Phycisphaerales bacterium]